MNRHARPLRPWWHLLPAGTSVPFVALGTAWLLLFGSCSGVLTAVDVANGKATTESVLTSLLVFGIFLLPVTALLFFVGALLAGKWAARTLLLAATLGTLLLAVGASLVNAAGDADPVGGVALIAVLLGLPVAGVLVALLVSGLLAVREVRASVARARGDRVRELVGARGEVDYLTIAEEARFRPARVEPFLQALIARGELAAVLDSEVAMVFSPERYAQKQRDLVSVAWGRGRASVSELAAELRLSPPRLHALLLTALEAGTFSGFIDTRTGEVVSASLRDLRDGRSCPSCGGQMELAGRGVIVCGYCRAEVFLPLG